MLKKHNSSKTTSKYLSTILPSKPLEDEHSQFKGSDSRLKRNQYSSKGKHETRFLQIANVVESQLSK